MLLLAKTSPKVAWAGLLRWQPLLSACRLLADNIHQGLLLLVMALALASPVLLVSLVTITAVASQADTNYHLATYPRDDLVPLLDILLEFQELVQKAETLSMHPPPGLLIVGPLLIHGPQVI